MKTKSNPSNEIQKHLGNNKAASFRNAESRPMGQFRWWEKLSHSSGEAGSFTSVYILWTPFGVVAGK